MCILKKILLIQIVLMICATCLFAEQSQPPPDQKVAKRKTHDLSFAVSIDSVLYKIKQKRDVAFIDVRNQDEYTKIHIPGSMNVPLYSIKTKPFLKKTPIVLVNNGFNYNQLENECKKLKEGGFNVSILWGGLTAWKDKGMEFEGDLFSVNRLNRISSREVYLEKDYEGFITMSISTESTIDSNEFFPECKHLKTIDTKTISPVVAAQNRNPFICVLIFNKDGTGYDEYEKSVKKSGLINVFYLSGGLNGYSGFLKDVALSIAPRQDREKTVNKCSP
ncbi:MAG: rhodanese-like domain-containing protein [Desulfosalsimonadaceae bacterium]